MKTSIDLGVEINVYCGPLLTELCPALLTMRERKSYGSLNEYEAHIPFVA
jgi:hypothetical protein